MSTRFDALRAFLDYVLTVGLTFIAYIRNNILIYKYIIYHYKFKLYYLFLNFN